MFSWKVSKSKWNSRFEMERVYIAILAVSCWWEIRMKKLQTSKNKMISSLRWRECTKCTNVENNLKVHTIRKYIALRFNWKKLSVTKLKYNFLVDVPWSYQKVSWWAYCRIPLCQPHKPVQPQNIMSCNNHYRRLSRQIYLKCTHIYLFI